MDADDIFFRTEIKKFVGDGTFTEDQINYVIDLVKSDDTASNTQKLEFMIDFLYQDTFYGSNSTGTTTEEGAVGFGISVYNKNDFCGDFAKLATMFPDVSPKDLEFFCEEHEDLNLEEKISELCSSAHIKKEKDPLDLWDHLREMLPHADPTYLRNQARVLVNRSEEEVEDFVENAIEKGKYPTMKDYLRNKEETDELALYTDHFSIDEYLEKIPNPTETFSDPQRPSPFKNATENDLDFAKNFLYDQYPFVRKRDIDRIFTSLNQDLIRTSKKLKSFPKSFRIPRQPSSTEDGAAECRNVLLLQEITYLRYESLIKQTLKQKQDNYRLAYQEAEKYGLLETCRCCFYDKLIPEECFFCTNDCIFCKDCVRSAALIVIAHEETDFPCLEHCDGVFHYITLKMVLDKKTFKRVCQRRQREEIKNANIDGLESCLWCDFSMIPKEGDKIFKCGNQECLRESCRDCGREAHIPLRCDEYEEDKDVQVRTFIENKMTEALVRKCHNCHKKIYKESGCNKMTCVCHAMMCYVCGAALTQDYKHFSENGCPLYTDNPKRFYFEGVLRAAELAKKEMGVDQDPKKLVIDPTKGFSIDDV